MRYNFLSFIFSALLSCFFVNGQDSISIAIPEDTLQSEAFLDVIETSLIEYYKEQSNLEGGTVLVEMSDPPKFADSVYCERLAKMNELSPFHLDCNKAVLQTIDYFSRKRRTFTQATLSRSALYFDMYEEKLAKHDMPLELKYLSVIESGLRPQIKSRAGALGLWQFMYRTGKMYGLEENSYIDERMDPELATEAACRYLKKLYSMYDDWNMALAAYNAGPGNVNKAIRRSGGKMTYWEIRPYLPRETRGYVPNFIAMSYMMTYYKEHNITLTPPKVYDFELDTVCLQNSLHMETIDSLLGWPLEEIQYVNPIYKSTYIPKTEPKQCISIPVSFVKDWIKYEDSIYKLDSVYFHTPSVEEILEGRTSDSKGKKTVHYVRSGESLSVIANRYGTSVSKLMDWNNLRSTRLRIGQKLNVYGGSSSASQNASSSSSSSSSSSENIPSGRSYTIKSGDSFWKISQNTGVSTKKLQQLNPNLDPTDLKVGTAIRIK